MAEFSPDSKHYQFFQIKTKEDSVDWTVAELSKREKKKVEDIKNLFGAYALIATLYQIMILMQMLDCGNHILKTKN